MFEYSLATRRRMKKIIGLLEQNKDSEVNKLVSSHKYARALSILSDIGCVKVEKAWGGDIVGIWLLDKSATYQLDRHELWVNRIVSFVFGIISCIVVQFVVSLIT